jgi:hypothetical protein
LQEKPNILRRFTLFYQILAAVFLAILIAAFVFWQSIGPLLGSYDFWKTFASPIATGIAALVAARITYKFGKTQAIIAQQQTDVAQQQARFAEVRLQHDLFDRRFKIYQAVRIFVIEEIVRHSRVSDEALETYLRGTVDAVFLFDDQLTKYLSEIREHATRLRLVMKLLKEGASAPDKRTGYVNEEAELVTWFQRNQKVIIKKFKPFLALREHKIIS